MRQEIHTPPFWHRLTQRPNILMVLLVGVLLSAFEIFTGPKHTHNASFLLPFIFLFLQIALAPIPWHWTSKGNPPWLFIRRFSKALVFSVVWVCIASFAVHHIKHLNPDHPHPGGEVQGPTAEFREGPPDDRENGPGGPPDLGQAPRGPHPVGPKPDHNSHVPPLGIILINVAFALVYGWETAEREITEARERRTQELLRQSQARSLRNQLEPHVLYNALNGLSELIHEDPLAAEEVVARLASLYRILTDYGKAELVHLSEERKVVESYLAMEQMRLGERLHVEWDWPEWGDAIMAPPLFLQPLVENAIKHGISPLDSGGELRISCLREGGTLVLQVANTGCAPHTGPREGVGLGNLADRLKLWQEADGIFSLSRDGEWTVARVSWTLHQ